ncbi:MAG: hypothetical protein ACM3PT_03715 [Deltaproteobacteria bacterium]
MTLITNLFLVLTFLVIDSNLCFSQNLGKFDSVRTLYIYNNIVNHYLCRDALVDLANSGMKYDINNDYVSILTNRLNDKQTIQSYCRYFGLDSQRIVLSKQEEFNHNSFVSQFNCRSFMGDVTNLKEEMLKDTNCVVLFELSDIYSYNDKFVVFVCINNLFIDTIVSYYYMYEFRFCPQSGLLEFLTWTQFRGFFFEGDKCMYLRDTNDFKDNERFCDY